MADEGAAKSSQSGLGIGLALARRLVEMHGGAIDVRSDGPRRGSEFVILMPLATRPPQARPEEAMDSVGIDCSVVVIEDNRDAAELMVMLVQELGGECRAAYDREIRGLENSQEYGGLPGHGLPLRTDKWGRPLVDWPRYQRLAAPVTVYIEMFTAHPHVRELYAPPDRYVDSQGVFSKQRKSALPRPEPPLSSANVSCVRSLSRPLLGGCRARMASMIESETPTRM